MTGTAILLRLPTVNRTFSFVPVSENRFFKIYCLNTQLRKCYFNERLITYYLLQVIAKKTPPKKPKTKQKLNKTKQTEEAN